MAVRVTTGISGVGPAVKRRLTSEEVAVLRVALFDGGTGLQGPSLGRLQFGSSFIFDPFLAYDAGLVSNPNVLVTGAIGVGKSSLVKMLLARGLQSGRRAVVMDPKGEYGDLAREHGGVVVTLGGDQGNWTSPFTGELRDDLSLAESFLGAARGRPLADDERFALETAWVLSGAALSPRPLRSLLDVLGRRLAEVAPSPERELAYTVRRLVDGDLAGLFDGAQPVSAPDGSLVVLDLSASWATDEFALCALAAMALSRRLLEGPRAGYLVVDEAWAVLVDPRVAHWLHGSWKLARARATSHVLVLHRWSDAFAVADQGSAQRTKATGILRDCDTCFLFRQDPGELHLLDEVIRLHSRERDYLVSLPRGVALARYGPHRSVVRVEPDEADRRIIDTDQAMRAAP